MVILTNTDGVNHIELHFHRGGAKNAEYDYFHLPTSQRQMKKKYIFAFSAPLR